MNRKPPFRFDDLSIIMVWRDNPCTWRNASHRWIKSRYEQLFPGAELIETDAPGSFKRGESFNLGAAQSERDFLLLADADSFTSAFSIFAGVQLLREGAPWVIPYGPPGPDEGCYITDEQSGAWILKQDPTAEILPHDLTYEHHLLSWGGTTVIHRHSFEAVGGFDPRFSGWGFEDNAFVAACDTLLGPHERVSGGSLIHIWHPALESETWQQPHIETNRALYAQYDLARGNFDAMFRLVKGMA